MEKDSQNPVQHPAVDKTPDWVYYQDYTIREDLLGLSLSTLDFKVLPRYSVASLPEDRAFHELVRNPKLIKDDFVIPREQIPAFIHSLEEATGGKGTFRYLTVQTPHIRSNNWNLKFIRFYLNPKGDGNFVVCDKFSRAIRWKEIIPNIVQSELHLQDTSKLSEDDQRRILERDFGAEQQP